MGNQLTQGQEIIHDFLEKKNISDEKLNEVFAHYDKNSDKALSYKEAQVLMSDIINLHIAFVKDKPEASEVEELAKKKKIKKWRSLAYMKNVLSTMDNNNDGNISYLEFKAWFTDFLDYGSPDNTTRMVSSIRTGKDEDGSKTVNAYIILSSLGQGSFGKVKLCMHSNTNKAFAMKHMKKSELKKIKRGITGKTALDAIYDEIDIQKSLKHPNIVKLYEVMDDKSCDDLFLILEYINGGESFSIGKQKDGVNFLTEEKTKQHMIDLIFGVEYMHYNKVVHRDLKPENLLISSTDGRLKISDFGESHRYIQNYDILKSGYGTPGFSSPEACSGAEYSGRSADIWAMGITMYVFLFGNVPFSASNISKLYKDITEKKVNFEKFKRVLKDEDGNDKSKLSKECLDFLSKVLEKDPKKRLTLKQMKDHPWLHGNKEWDKYDGNKHINYIHKPEKAWNRASSHVNEITKKTSSRFRPFGFNSVSEAEDLGPPMRRRKRTLSRMESNES